MASLCLDPPRSFNFKYPDEWPRWKRRFEQFRLASGLTSESEERQVSTLLYCMGEAVEDTLSSTNISSKDRKKYESVMTKFDTFFNVRKNVIFERAHFNRRRQGPNESIEQFITSLYQLAETCEYGGLKVQLIRDRIVVGIRDQLLSERLQQDSELTLKKAKTITRQREAIHEQQVILDTGESSQPSSVDAIKHKGASKTESTKSQTTTDKSSKASGQSKNCSRCGRGPHSRHMCPAKDATCHACKKKGHFKSQCYSTKAIADIITFKNEYDNSDITFLNTIDSAEDNTWNKTILVEGKQVCFKLDTGAEATVLSEEVMELLGVKQLKKPTKELCGPDQKPLEVLGELYVNLSHKGTTVRQPVFVVKQLKKNLLGLPAIRALNLLVMVESIEDEISTKYPSLFSGLGSFPDTYKIQLNPDVKPYALFTPRNIPLPQHQKVQNELERVESLGVISRINEPTQWCAGIVVVPKKDKSVCICVDFRQLNESVLREVHPLPKVEDTLAQVHGAVMFSKVDANCGFWQVPLSDSSKPLTTFITPFGRYHFNKLPFGISSAPEHFQRQMSKILSGLPGILCHMDDILIFGNSKEEHDTRLHNVLQKLQMTGVTLNRSKCEFGKERLTFLGHVLDKHGISPDPDKTKAIVNMCTPRTPTELRRFLGMVNQLGKFTPRIAELSSPLRGLLSTKNTWVWGESQDQSFEAIKQELAKPTVLALYNLEAKTKVCADASTFGLGAVLLQQQQSEWKPVAYASRTMSETEQRYSQIEKEALALVWACEKFSGYILGKRVHLETDHKPLVPLLSKTHLDRLPPRVL